MSEKKATRAAYGEMLVELADKYPELVVLDADLAGATMTKGFAQACPDRFFDMGIAEANMIGVAAGLVVQRALATAELLAGEGVSARVLDFHTIKPLDGEALLAAARETGCIVTTEEHSIVGGLGAAVASFLAERCPVPVLRHAVRDVFGRSGKAEQVLEAYGLTPAGIVETARAALELKR